jgi:type IV pilus assembly protein PilE
MICNNLHSDGKLRAILMNRTEVRKFGNRSGQQRGFSLLELMIVVAIIAIISAIAYPSYMQFVVTAKRTTASSALLRVADMQQQFFMDNKRYTDDLTDLGLAANPLVINNEGEPVAAGDADSIYSIALSDVTATTYTATAAPQKAQADRDDECASLTMTQAGAKGHTGTGDDCW